MCVYIRKSDILHEIIIFIRNVTDTFLHVVMRVFDHKMHSWRMRFLDKIAKEKDCVTYIIICMYNLQDVILVRCVISIIASASSALANLIGSCSTFEYYVKDIACEDISGLSCLQT